MLLVSYVYNVIKTAKNAFTEITCTYLKKDIRIHVWNITQNFTFIV